MNRLYFLTAVNVIFLFTSINAQVPYFPPLIGDSWATLTPASQGYCAERIDSLYAMLERENTRAFLLVKDGRIVLEKYFGSFTSDSTWYWASAGKSLTGFLVGLAQEDGHLSINDPSSMYLGKGWTSASEEQESKITIKHQLTMTTGLDDGAGNRDCTDPECLKYLSPPDSRWAYHNAPYTLLDEVIETATGQNLNLFTFSKLRNSTGITGLYIKLGYNNVFFSKPRSMARFGLLMLNKGNWNGTQVMKDTSYFNQMIRPSQMLNQSYGYLWWLNGQSSFMIPQLQFVFPGSFTPNAPSDMYAAMGKNGQILNVVPSQNLILVRMGDAPGSDLVPFMVNDRIWRYINQLNCTSATVDQNVFVYKVYPNPAKNEISVEGIEHPTLFTITDIYGKILIRQDSGKNIDVSNMPSGNYFVVFNKGVKKVVLPFLKL
ncbi:MAG: serine hydrolase [Saprospiraceae bacterium]|nr:serine hydrolase [Saprospiraceae bacterium]